MINRTSLVSCLLFLLFFVLHQPQSFAKKQNLDDSSNVQPSVNSNPDLAPDGIGDFYTDYAGAVPGTGVAVTDKDLAINSAKDKDGEEWFWEKIQPDENGMLPLIVFHNKKDPSITMTVSAGIGTNGSAGGYGGYGTGTDSGVGNTYNYNSGSTSEPFYYASIVATFGGGCTKTIMVPESLKRVFNQYFKDMILPDDVTVPRYSSAEKDIMGFYLSLAKLAKGGC